MTLSYALESSLRSHIFSEEACGYTPNLIPVNYENNTVFSKFLEIVLPYDGECFIPVMGLSDTLGYIHQWLESVSPTQPVKISYPLFIGGADTKKTGDSIIQSINRCPKSLRLTNIKTSKGLDYYGGQGLIFDEHWSPLMLCGFLINIDRINRHINIINPICYVTPKVFENNDILSKTIIKKVIPFISMKRVSVPEVLRYNGTCAYNSSSFINIPVIVKSVDNYFSSPSSPTEIEGLDNSIWNFLSENANDLI